MKLQTIAIAGLFAAAVSGCSPDAEAPISSNLSAQDLDSLTAAYNLTQFDLAECAQLTAGGASAATLNASRKICSDAGIYETKMEAIALARNVTLPTEMSYDLKVRFISLKYHPSPDVNAQYLQDAIASHQQALMIFNDEMANGRDQQIMAFDQGAAPIVQSNLDALQAARAAD